MREKGVVWLRCYVDQVVIGCAGNIIARHQQCLDREEMVFNPVHSLPLLEQQVGALDQAALLAEWDLPEEFAPLRHMMADLHIAIKNVLPRGTDAVKHLVLCQVEKRPPKLDLYPCLPKDSVSTTSAARYMSPIRRRAA